MTMTRVRHCARNSQGRSPRRGHGSPRAERVMRRALLLTVYLGAASLFAGCGGDDPGGSAPTDTGLPDTSIGSDAATVDSAFDGTLAESSAEDADAADTGTHDADVDTATTDT